MRETIKFATAIVLLAWIVLGSYSLGKASADTWWKPEAERIAHEREQEAIKFEKKFRWDLSLAPPPIVAGIYIGCGRTGPIYILNIKARIMFRNEISYGFYLESCGIGGATLDGTNFYFKNTWLELSPKEEGKP